VTSALDDRYGPELIRQSPIRRGQLASAVSQLPSAARDAARDSLLGAEAVAARLPVDDGHALLIAANDPSRDLRGSESGRGRLPGQKP
jgi:hypothetical protein